MGGGGGEGGLACQSDHEIRGAGLKFFFSALRALVWSKNKWWGEGPPGPSPGSATENGDISSGLAYRS